MKKFIIEVILIIAIASGVVVTFNCYADPANLFHDEIFSDIIEQITTGHAVSVTGDFDERIFQRELIKSLDKDIDTYILGSSHIMYIPWEYSNYYCAGVSGAVTQDNMAILGFIEKNAKKIDRVVLCIDSWMFLENNGQTRYKSIEREYLEEYNKITGLNTSASFSLSDLIPVKVRELFSPSYFQSSIKAFIKSLFLKKNQLAINNDSGRIIYPTGTHSPYNSNSAQQNINDAKRNIAMNTVYSSKRNAKISEEEKKLFEQFTKYLLREGIKLDFYLPAYHPVYYHEFATSKAYSYILEIEDYVVNYARNNSIPLHGSYNPELSGITVNDFMDSIHLKPEIGLMQYKNTIR